VQRPQFGVHRRFVGFENRFEFRQEFIRVADPKASSRTSTLIEGTDELPLGGSGLARVCTLQFFDLRGNEIAQHFDLARGQNRVGTHDLVGDLRLRRCRTEECPSHQSGENGYQTNVTD